MASGRQKHILLVEDDADTLSATTAVLERLGYRVRTETESVKALRTFSEDLDLFDPPQPSTANPQAVPPEAKKEMRAEQPVPSGISEKGRSWAFLGAPGYGSGMIREP
jgi:CheY-like chemotaxis protein